MVLLPKWHIRQRYGRSHWIWIKDISQIQAWMAEEHSGKDGIGRDKQGWQRHIQVRIAEAQTSKDGRGTSRYARRRHQQERE